MNIIVNDANILIDIIELQLTDPFFRLGYAFHTTSLIYEELFEEQQQQLSIFVARGRLTVSVLSAAELEDIHRIQTSKPALSEQDCSAFFQAQRLNGILITSDKLLRTFAEQQRLPVHGHLWVFDRLIEARLVTGPQAVQKLQELQTQINPALGLPKSECSKRIELWKGM